MVDEHHQKHHLYQHMHMHWCQDGPTSQHRFVPITTDEVLVNTLYVRFPRPPTNNPPHFILADTAMAGVEVGVRAFDLAG